MLQTGEGKKTFAVIQQLYAEYCPLIDRAIQLRRAGKTEEAINVIFAPEATATRNELLKNTGALVEMIDGIKKTAQDEQNASEAETKILMLGLACVGLLIGLMVAILITRSITGAISRCSSSR